MLDKADKENVSTFETFKTILHNKCFVSYSISLALVYFVSTNIQFWMTDYIVTVIGADKKNAYACFMIVCITAPTSGAICSGFLG